MEFRELKIFTFYRKLNTYSFERQLLAIVLFNYALLGVFSFISLFFIQAYIYTWPLWTLIIIIALSLMEAALRVQNIKMIREFVLIISTLILAPLGLYFSGSITSPSSVYVLVVLINVCLLSNGRKRNLYFLVLAVITISFMVIENYFPNLFLFPTPSGKDRIRIWNFIYPGLAWIIFKEVSSVTNVLSTQHQLLKSKNETLHHKSIVDDLTHLFNKKHLIQTLNAGMADLRRNGSTLGILLIDIDDFKAYNDHYGHLEGDACLKEVAGLIKASLLREGDKAFRFGGEEFVVVISPINLEGTKAIAKRLLSSMKERRIPHEHSSAGDYVSVSIGIAVYTQLHANLSRDDLLMYPDKAMYEAKRLGKNRYTVIDSF